jgi:hypothetical protein
LGEFLYWSLPPMLAAAAGMLLAPRRLGWRAAGVVVGGLVVSALAPAIVAWVGMRRCESGPCWSWIVYGIEAGLITCGAWLVGVVVGATASRLRRPRA